MGGWEVGMELKRKPDAGTELGAWNQSSKTLLQYTGVLHSEATIPITGLLHQCSPMLPALLGCPTQLCLRSPLWGLGEHEQDLFKDETMPAFHAPPTRIFIDYKVNFADLTWPIRAWFTCNFQLARCCKNLVCSNRTKQATYRQQEAVNSLNNHD